jgi:two-component system sensor histidine kinase KdpD
VHVGATDGLAGADRALLATQRMLVEGLGGSYHEVLGDDVPRALLEFATGVNATQLVLGTSRRGRFARALSAGVGATVTARSGSIDVHLVTHDAAPPPRARRRPPPALSRRRQVSGFATALVGLPVLTVGLSHVRTHIALSSDIMLFLMLVVAVALVGGLWPALTAALVGSALLNYFFTPPIHKWTISHHDNLLGIAAYVCVAIAVSAVVDVAARRARDATRAGADAEILASLADAVLRGERAVADLLTRLREIYALSAVALLERNPDAASTASWRADPAAWRVVAGAGGPPPTRATRADADAEVALADDLVLVLRGPALPAGSRRVLEAFGAQTVLALRQQRLTEAAEATEPLLRADQVRRALLSAVSHDLRTPLASARAAVQSLRNDTIAWAPEERGELLATAHESLERLDGLVANLLDMSRLQADALGLAPVPLAVEDVVPHALDELGPASADVRISVPSDLPEILADPGLLERVLVNLVANALRFNPPGRPVLVSASSLGDTVEIRVVDHGPGIPAADRERVFQAFQRLGDHDNHNGVGLGLAVARGLAEAMGGGVVPEDTPGGGLTMVLAMPCAPVVAPLP